MQILTEAFQQLYPIDIFCLEIGSNKFEIPNHGIDEMYDVYSDQ